MSIRYPVVVATLLLYATTVQGGQCPASPASLQVLGSGGTTLSHDRAGSSFLVWQNGKAAILVNLGGGSALRFAQSGADIKDLKAVLLTNVQADATAALPALVQVLVDSGRKDSLPVHGPGGYRTVPSTVALVRALFEVSGGAYRDLGNVLTPLERNAFKLEPHNIDIKFRQDEPLLDKRQTSTDVFIDDNITVRTTPVDRNGLPALAWRMDVHGKSVVFAGKTTARTDHLPAIARDADVLVIHGPDASKDSVSLANIGRLARQSGVKKIVLTHAPAGSSVNGDPAIQTIRNFFNGEILIPNDLDCYGL